MTFRHIETQLERHFKVNVVLDFIKTTPLKEVKELAECDLYKLYNEWENEQYWLNQFPPEDYVFEGLVVGYVQDVTESEVLSQMKEMLIGEEEEEDPAKALEDINRQICAYLDMPDVVFGNLMNRTFKYAELTAWSIIGGIEELALFSQKDFEDSVTYGEAIETEAAVIIGDLRRVKKPTKVELQLIEKGYRSLLLVPQRDGNGKKIGVMELASTQAYRFNRQVLDKMGEIISLFNLGANPWIQRLDNRINFFIQKQFTYIHPSVEWKFRKVSQNYLLAPPEAEQPAILEPIGFKDVYPLYGQADIVGSSKIRNHSIQEDMLDNLRRVQVVIKAFRKQLDFQLLDLFLAKTTAFVQRLENGNFVSSDKKRIDKAVIKGTNERLTQKGKVAIVWLQDKDRAEYMEYLQHLLEKGYITDDIEELELERLQGADGLKALRVTVALGS